MITPTWCDYVKGWAKEIPVPPPDAESWLLALQSLSACVCPRDSFWLLAASDRSRALEFDISSRWPLSWSTRLSGCVYALRAAAMGNQCEIAQGKEVAYLWGLRVTLVP